MMIRKHLLAAAIVSYSGKAVTKPITTTATKSAAATTTTNLAATTSSTSSFQHSQAGGGYCYNMKNLQFRGGGGKVTPATTTATSSAMSMSTSSGNNEINSRNDNVVDDINKNGDTPPSLPSLVLIGDKELMTSCEPCNQKDIDELKSSNDDDSSDDDNNDNNILKKQLQDLKACQKYYGGIGIAACQVGWRARIFCMGIESCDVAAKSRYPDASEFIFQYWINPIIKPDPASGKSWFWEGCLSVPGMRGWVERPNVVTLCGYNEFGEYREVKLDGLPARVAQHEYDHLDGILFPNRALPNTLLPVQAFEKQDNWPLDWPTSGSRQTKPGGFSYDK